MNKRGPLTKRAPAEATTVLALRPKDAAIAAELGIPVDRVCRILRSRPHVSTRAFAGNTRLFDNAAIAEVRHELNAIDARREVGAR